MVEGKKPSVREEPEDNEPGDVPESRLHPRPILKRKYKIYGEACIVLLQCIILYYHHYR